LAVARNSGGRKPHFAMRAHFFSVESIAVCGDSAIGKWMMLQTSTYTAGNADLRSAALTISLAREDGKWRIANFRTANIFSRRVDHWNDTADIPVPERASSGDEK